MMMSSDKNNILLLYLKKMGLWDSRMRRRRRTGLFCTLLLFVSVLMMVTMASAGSGRRHDVFEDDLFPEGGSNADVDDAKLGIFPGGSTVTNKNSNNNNNNNKNGVSGQQQQQLVKDSTGCPVQFQSRCVCGLQFADHNHPSNVERGKKYYVVDCTDSGFTDASMLSYLPEETGKLIFTGNQIEVLDRNILGMKEYPNLKWIDMSNNKIQEIKGQAFHHVSAVEILMLSNNELSNKSIHDHSRVFSNFFNLKSLHLTNAFNDEIWSLSDLAGIFAESTLTKLEKLHLEQNEMGIIQNENLFCDLESLRQLYLADNKLSDLHINVSCFKDLDYVDVSRNEIRSITKSSALYSLISQVNPRTGNFIRINLGENPFRCDCNLQPYIDWVKNMTQVNVDRIFYHEKLHCFDGVPSINQGLHLTQVKRTECQVLQISNLSAVSSTLVWILSFLVILLVLALLIFHRKAVAHTIQPLLQSAAHGVKYTSIDPETTAEIAHV